MDTGNQPDWVYVTAAVVSILVTIWTVLSWLRDTYSIDGNMLHTRCGVFTVTERTIPLDKINSLDIKQTWVHRFLSIAKLEVTTADSNNRSDATLVLSVRKARELEANLHLIERSEDGKRDVSIYTRRTTNKELFMMAISSPTFWLGVPFVITVITYIGQWMLPDESAQEASIGTLFDGSTWAKINMSLLFFWLLVFMIITICSAWLISLVVIQVKYYGWTVARTKDVVTIQYGMFEPRLVRIPARKIQSIRIKEPFSCRMYGYVSVWIDCVGFEGDRKVKVLLPAMKRTELVGVIRRLLPEFSLKEDIEPLQGSGRYITAIQVSLLPLLLIVAASIWIGPILLAVCIPASMGVIRARNYARSGWTTYRNQIILSKWGFTRTTVYVLRNAVQAISYRQNRVQRILGYSVLYIDIDSPSKRKEYRLEGIPLERVQQITIWYKNQEARLADCS